MSDKEILRLTARIKDFRDQGYYTREFLKHPWDIQYGNFSRVLPQVHMNFISTTLPKFDGYLLIYSYSLISHCPSPTKVLSVFIILYVKAIQPSRYINFTPSTFQQIWLGFCITSRYLSFLLNNFWIKFSRNIDVCTLKYLQLPLPQKCYSHLFSST